MQPEIYYRFSFLKIYIIALVAFLGIDAVWLLKTAPSFYKNNIGHLMVENPKLLPAGIFYAFNIIGILIFAVLPGLHNDSAKSAIVLGALYGFLTYATYDFTNYATLEGWPLKVVVVDILWGPLSQQQSLP